MLTHEGANLKRNGKKDVIPSMGSMSDTDLNETFSNMLREEKYSLTLNA